MKKTFALARLVLIGLCLTLFSCEKEDIVPKPVLGEDVLSYSIYTDESVKLKPEITIEGDDQYVWKENSEELSNEPTLEYQSEKVGIHNIVFTAHNESGVAINIYTIEVKQIPLATITMEDGQESMAIPVGKTMTIAPTVETIREATYSWLNGEKEISTKKDLTYTFDTKGEYKFTLKVTNPTGTTTQEIAISVLDDCSNGIFMLNEGNMSNETGIVSFIDNNGVKIDSIYQKANNGEKLGNVTQDMWITNDKIYFIAQNGRRNEGGDRFIVCDRSTMRRLASVDEGFGTWPTHLAVTNNNKAYVRDNGGVSIVDLSTMEVTGTLEGGSGAQKQKMEYINDRVLIAAGAKLLVVNPSNDKVENIETDGSIAGICKGTDHCLWVSTNNNVLYKVETNTFTIEETYSMPEGFSLRGSWGSNGICSNYNENSIIWKSGTNICKFNATTKEGKVLCNTAETFENGNMIYGGLGVDPLTNEVYVGYIKGYGYDYLINGIGVVDGETGAKARVYKNCIRFSVSAYSTANFDY